MNLTELDKELLESLALELPWEIVCDEFQQRYGSPGALARRLCELQHVELLTIRSRASGELETSAGALETDAVANSCYADITGTSKLGWDIAATDNGFEVVKERLRPE